MTTIRKIGGLVILTALFLSPVSAETAAGNYGFSLSSNIGFLYGQGEEIVYKFPGRDLYLSELLWDLKPLFYAGLGVDFGPADHSGRHGFTASLSIKSGLPLNTGITEDRDWMNNDLNYLTHYSRHDAYSRSSILLDVSAGYLWRFAGSLSLNVFGEFSWTYLSWSARDGYIQHASLNPDNQYQEWNKDILKIYRKGEVLRYSQNWFIFSPGLSLNWNINSLFSLKGLFNYSPLIYCANRDDHLSRDITFFDYLYFGHCFKSGGEFVFSASKRISLSLFLSYKYITGPRGDTKEGARYDRDVAGAGYSGLDMGLAVKFRLTRDRE